MNATSTCCALLAAFGAALLIGAETPRGSVRGVVAKNDTAIADIPVALTRGEETPDAGKNAQWFRATTDSRGQFELRMVPAGNYRLFAQSGRWRDEVSVEVTEGAPTRSSLKLERIRPDVSLVQPVRDPERVRRRARDILNALPRLSRPLLDTIRRNNLSGDVAGRDSLVPLPILIAQAGAESSFNPELAGALDEVGLFQLRPLTANDQGFGPIEPERLLDAGVNTRLASRFLGTLQLYFADTRIALGAYNQGAGRTERDGLYPAAQIYADAILLCANHDRLKQRVLELDPTLGHLWQP